jgi:hypothetical protein
MWPPGPIVARVRRAFTAAGPGAVLSTRQLLDFAYPRESGGGWSRRKRDMHLTVRRACERLGLAVPAAVAVARRCCGGCRDAIRRAAPLGDT